MATGRGVQNVLAKLKRSVDEKNYYEAHQMYKTLYFRYWIIWVRFESNADDVLYNEIDDIGIRHKNIVDK